MRISTTLVSAGLVGLAACASGSVVNDSLLSGGTSDAGSVIIVGTGDAGSQPIIISTTTSSSTTTTTSSSSSSPPSDDDAGTGFTDPGDDDAGSGFDFDAGGGGGGETCEGYAYPDTFADCTCAASDQSECQNNGCYGGYYCDTDTNACHSKLPAGCQ